MATWLTGLLVLASSAMAHADPASGSKKEELPPRRYEFVPLVGVGGNSDVGLELGISATLARFYDDARPYKWLLGVALSSSFKTGDGRGLRMLQQYHVLHLDLPGLFGGRVRIDSRANIARNISTRYDGLGNASSIKDLPLGPLPLRRNEYIAQNVRIRSLVRVKTGTPFDAGFAAHLRYEFPEAYPGSKLEYDAKYSGLAGTERALLAGVAGGLILDTRDFEFAPHRGIYYQLGVLGMVGSAERVAYGEVSTQLASYIPLGPSMTLATRVFASFQFGRVPFYVLQQGGVFEPEHMVGDDRGVRGIPEGRYAGHIKVIANYELRTTFIPPFHVLSWILQIGTTTFFDAGRVWNNYDTSAFDGRTPGIKYSVGGGFYFQWDRSSVLRLEVAYSPTDHEPSGFPLGYYLADRLIF
ncbi:outer membrane protein assembly factor [Pendulispora brunnea]|uniref:Outer membrane protein assembly factor n=1 Tax=Pendulispora brunnea TaxID=2905690 RepID=A0ABZ2KDQ1_9BACT